MQNSPPPCNNAYDYYFPIKRGKKAEEKKIPGRIYR